jgi:hypothetical protein
MALVIGVLCVAGPPSAGAGTLADAPAQTISSNAYECRKASAENNVAPPKGVAEAFETQAAKYVERVGSAALHPLERERLAEAPCAPGQVAYPRPLEGAAHPGAFESEASLGSVDSPPGPAAPSMAPPSGGSGSGYYYTGSHWVVLRTFGLGAYVSIGSPKIGNGAKEEHSLGQLLIGDGFGTQTVEFGWSVDRAFGDANPHLFTYVNKDAYKSDGQPGGDCYNCHFVPLAGTKYVPGQTLSPSATPILFLYYYTEGKWWLDFNGEAIGYLEGSFWPGGFTEGLLASVYGEVYDPNATTATAMGNGLRGTEPGALSVLTPEIFTQSFLYPGGVVDGAVSGTEGPLEDSAPGWYNTGNVRSDGRGWSWGGPGGEVTDSKPLYHLVNASSGRCVDVEGYSLAPTARIDQWDCYPAKGHANQVFGLIPEGPAGYFNVYARHSGECLDVIGASLSPTAGIQQYSCLGSGQANQLWRLQAVGSNYQVISKNSGMCLDLPGANPANGVRLQQYPCLGAGQTNQLWRLERLP